MYTALFWDEAIIIIIISTFPKQQYLRKRHRRCFARQFNYEFGVQQQENLAGMSAAGQNGLGHWEHVVGVGMGIDAADQRQRKLVEN